MSNQTPGDCGRPAPHRLARQVGRMAIFGIVAGAISVVLLIARIYVVTSGIEGPF